MKRFSFGCGDAPDHGGIDDTAYQGTEHHGQSRQPVPALGGADGAFNIDGGRLQRVSAPDPSSPSSDGP